MENTYFRFSWDPNEEPAPDQLLRKEWLITNGASGYASGTLSGIPTRRYHGLLIAALPVPFGRQLFLNHLRETVVLPDGTSGLLSTKTSSPEEEKSSQFRLSEFRLESGLPVWTYELGEFIIERKILMLHNQNTVHVRFQLTGAAQPVTIRLQPSVHFRHHEDIPSVVALEKLYSVSQQENRFEISANDSKLPPLRLRVVGSSSTFTHHSSEQSLLYHEEKNRGYPFEASLWSPGYFETTLTPGMPVTLIGSTESWDAISSHSPEEALEAETGRRARLLTTIGKTDASTPYNQLILAADQFIMTPAARVQDTTKSRALGEEPRSVIAGYHWFTDWGRDTMISLEGLTLATGRQTEARWILHTFALHLRNGLIPNLFPEGEREGLYHTADATLWFFHALERYLKYTGDRQLLQLLLPKMVEVIDWHCRGTDFGIGVDSKDGLLKQGAEGYQLTWMDAKVGDWVVTPRRGKAVEINALWYNALRLTEQWLRSEHEGERAAELGELADKVSHSFNERFWNEQAGYLYDVVDGEDGNVDPACRPNQVFAISLDYPVLAEKHWAQTIDRVAKELLTPVGLRSLSRSHPDYKASYNGDRRARDAAYHQGTVWAWLIGPFIDAWLRVYPDKTVEARSYLDGLINHLRDAGLGTISEVFDAEPPFTPRGCIAQAWSVAEVLRCWRMLDERDHK